MWPCRCGRSHGDELPHCPYFPWNKRPAMTDARATKLRALADDLERYVDADADDLLRSVGLEIAVLGGEIMVGEDREEFTTITIRLGEDRHVASERRPHEIRVERPRPLRRLAARLQRRQR